MLYAYTIYYIIYICVSRYDWQFYLTGFTVKYMSRACGNPSIWGTHIIYRLLPYRHFNLASNLGIHIRIVRAAECTVYVRRFHFRPLISGRSRYVFEPEPGNNIFKLCGDGKKRFDT